MAEQVHRDYLEPAVLARLAALPLDARVPMLGNVSGRHRSPIRGSSLEFSEYRKYVPGDDTRRLDWRAYARSDRFFIKEFEADTNLRMCLVVDTSGSMQYGDGGMTKLDYARRIAGTLAYLAARRETPLVSISPAKASRGRSHPDETPLICDMYSTRSARCRRPARPACLTSCTKQPNGYGNGP